MDNLTHSLAGALLGAALPAEHPLLKGQAMPLGARAAYCAVATNLPDLDYLSRFWATPLEVLNLHRGITHSFVMAPVWAALVGAAAWLLLRKRYHPLELALLALAALLLHSGLDLLTAYGTQLFAPFSNRAHALPLLFIIDPWVWAILGAGLVALWRTRSPAVARGALLALAGWVALCGLLMLRAEQVAADAAERRGFPRGVLVLPQPFAPTHWKVVTVDGDTYHTAYLDLLGGDARPPTRADAPPLEQMWGAYQPAHALEWTHRHRFGGEPLMRGFARFAYGREELVEWRRFALLPQLYALTNEGPDAGCGWFTDLRFEVRGRDNFFSVGVCHGPVEGRLSKSTGWRVVTDGGPPARGK